MIDSFRAWAPCHLYESYVMWVILRALLVQIAFTWTATTYIHSAATRRLHHSNSVDGFVWMHTTMINRETHAYGTLFRFYVTTLHPMCPYSESTRLFSGFIKTRVCRQSDWKDEMICTRERQSNITTHTTVIIAISH
jgi:hypothetical protein